MSASAICGTGLGLLCSTAVFFTIATTQVAAQQTWSPLPLEKLVEIGSVVNTSETPQWFPDGSQILFASSLGRSGLFTIETDAGFPISVPVTPAGAGHFLATSQFQISPDGQWIAYISDRTGFPEIWLLSISNGREMQLTRHGGRINSFSWSPDSRSIAFAGDRFGNYDIWKASVPDGEQRRLTSGNLYEVYPSWTPDSRSILYVQLDERWVDHEVIEISADGAAPRTVLQDFDFFDYGAGSKFGYPDVSPDGETVLFPSYRSGWINYWVAPLGGGEPRQLAPAIADQSDAVRSHDGRHVAFVENHNGTFDLRVVAVSGGETRVLVSRDEGTIGNLAWSPDDRSISYTHGNTTQPTDLYVVEVASGASRQLTNSAPLGNFESQLLKPEKIAYASSDGLTIHAYLYKPPVIARGERFPCILISHGGPTSQYADSFHRDAQFFAQRGYVVLMPNFRGSSGYGRAFEDANNGCWGRCDLEDMLAGVEYLKTLSYVDPDQMGITGSSYGGHMSTAAIAFAHGAFQAAIPASGYPNRVGFMDDGEFRHIQQMEFEFGPFAENRDKYYQHSPYFFIKDVETPAFLLHGEGRYPESPQMREFARMMEKEYKTFRYKAYQGETYYVRGRANTIQMYQDMLNYFDFYLKGKNVPLPGVTHLEELNRPVW
jgi:dipeptidyl aminopeptidase/acylaminoacyl peptidase